MCFSPLGAARGVEKPRPLRAAVTEGRLLVQSVQSELLSGSVGRGAGGGGGGGGGFSIGEMNSISCMAVVV